ncbi:hypothetical protein FGG08_006540 [Glutinoglossum americanum]|uniref:Nuclease S1 n=1 Tax=Glutinoglossum americanum TaxID=1670608 RepID=A0A9P8KUV8_9PEZI|nr:hypothetical protein FGG08_006540 [Glutinoglossum americanum]
MYTLLSTLLFFSTLVHLSNCWGHLGHRTVAYLAQKQLSPAGASYVTRLLRSEDISKASLWADEYRGRREGRFTSDWHFIDANDDPPRRCNVEYNRDCRPRTGCVVSAITNMTTRANDPSLPPKQHYEALKFLLHFIGDIHQPLHTEKLQKGGNGIHVLFDGEEVDLHKVWDTRIPDKHRDNEGSGIPAEKSHASAWADQLISVGTSEDWLKCTDITRAEDCALEWANEANDYICSYVLKNDVEGEELGGEYYDGAVPIVDELVAKAGFRLAAWIEGLAAERAAMMERGVVFEGPWATEQEVMGAEEL